VTLVVVPATVPPLAGECPAHVAAEQEHVTVLVAGLCGLDHVVAAGVLEDLLLGGELAADRDIAATVRLPWTVNVTFVPLGYVMLFLPGPG
jgi:hypothetical protein